MSTLGEEYESERGKLYQDQLYGPKVLSPLAVKVIDTPEFQRLVGLKQLGFASVVYRGAVHNRLCHSIGTYFLTRTIMRKISQNHERLGLPHPGKDLPNSMCIYPPNAFGDENTKGKKAKLQITAQCKWRGLTEIVSIAALLHDISHVPFGHTFEDEFSGLYLRHDNLAGPRLFELLFNEESSIYQLFNDANQPLWISKSYNDKDGLANERFLKLVYVILSWKDRVDPPADFAALLTERAKALGNDQSAKKRLEMLSQWYTEFTDTSNDQKPLFEPFMSDIIGNTICADLLDYLPRDRKNLGMEYRMHTRLQRYLTIRQGTLYDGEGRRVSIMVTRRFRGGQRRDVATAVLDVMRERYELAERVLYHHKKAAASAMLAKLAELKQGELYRDDAPIYPAPWSNGKSATHLIHYDDRGFIDYLGTVAVDAKHKQLQRNLFIGIRHDRRKMYRTLLVIDDEVVRMSSRSQHYFSARLRYDDNHRPSNAGRRDVERELAEAAEVEEGEVLVYCPSPKMQAKEVDARLEIRADSILPLRLQTEQFTYNRDIEVLQDYYRQLWQVYVFVAPALFSDRSKCLRIVDACGGLFEIEDIVLYNKVRGHNFKIDPEISAKRAMEPIEAFFRGEKYNGEKVPTFTNIPGPIAGALVQLARRDTYYMSTLKTDHLADQRIARLWQLLDAAILREESERLQSAQVERKESESQESMLAEPDRLLAEKLEGIAGHIVESEQYLLRVAARQDHIERRSDCKTYEEYRERRLSLYKQLDEI